MQTFRSLLSHLLSLLMPFTMVVLIPFWALRGNGIDVPIILRIVGVGLFVASFLLFASTVRLFIRIGKGTLAPWDPTKTLIIVGPYRYYRNPMISGVLGMIIAEAIFFASPVLVVWALIFFVVNTLYFIAYEEPDLLSKHGSEYRRYMQHVPRWLPRLRPYHAMAKGASRK